MPSQGGHTLLIVEDDEAIRSLIAATVPETWTVLEAGDGIEALSLAQAHMVDAAVLDHDLPLLDGASVCSALRQAGDGLRIVALTAHTTGDVRRAFTEAGADAVLTKPFSPVQLLDLLEEWETHRPDLHRIVSGTAPPGSADD